MTKCRLILVRRNKEDTRETKHETDHILLISSHRMCRNTWERHGQGDKCIRGRRRLSN